MNNYEVEYNLEELQRTDKGCIYKVSIKIPTTGWIDNVDINIFDSSEVKQIPLHFKSNEDNYAYFENIIELDTKAIYRYYFTYNVNGIKRSFQKNQGKELPVRDNMWKLSPNFKVPDWAQGKIIYHIFVDRFNKKDEKEELPGRKLHKDFNEEPVLGPNEEGKWNIDFYGGDLKGIIDKLDYIKSLGTGIIYLSPIVESQSNHRYDTADYLEIDPYVGHKEDLKELCREAHRRDMKVILDAVFNHTGNDSIYFNEYNNYDSIGAFQSNESPYKSFYRRMPNGDFDYWWGMKNLPVCDGNSRDWQEYITGENGVIDQWFKLGIDGLRLDVADELTDHYIERIREAVHRNKEDGFIIGEVWKNPMRMSRGYISSGKGMDSVMNYFLMDALIRYFKFEDVDKLKRVLEEIITEYPTETINSLMNSTSTHDISRAIEIFGANEFSPYREWAWDVDNGNFDLMRNHNLTEEEYEKGKEILKTYLYTLTFLPGNLTVFYGDEVGLQGLGNLLNRRPYPWGREDKELLEFYQILGAIRKQEPFLEKADLRILDINKDFFTFERIGEKNQALTTINRTPHEGYILIPPEYSEPIRHYSYKKTIPGKVPPYGAVTYIK